MQQIIFTKSNKIPIPLLGHVEAGFPSPAEEELVDNISFDEFLIDNREATYILKVKGDSMIDAGICPGDMVIVERVAEPKVGDIVIARIDGAWTMKFFKKRGGQVYLEPANKKYKPMVPTEELEIHSVVKGVVRKY
ncbi:MAG: transcriptional repressor LexA [Gammaproteobacteria bacterium]|nr:transcriptional repressor LexA [Gammaproteobacteria bacterium]